MANQETPFFLSYKRPDPPPSGWTGAHTLIQDIRQFYHHLCEDVSQLVYLSPGSYMGFMDVEVMPGGIDWQRESLRALGTCQVLVGLLSMPYLGSDWCGKEWHAFTLRDKKPLTQADTFQGCIIPVRWAPVRLELPSVVKDHVNIFTPTPTLRYPHLPQIYDREGVLGVLREDGENAVRVIVWQLARLIQNIYYGQRLELRQFALDDLTNVFGRGEP